MNKFDTLAAAAKANQIANCKARGVHTAAGYAEDGIYMISVTPVEGRVSWMRTVKMTCYINDKRVSKAKMQEMMG